MSKRKKDKRTNNHPQNITQKTNDQSTQIPLKTGGDLMGFERVSISCSTFRTGLAALDTNPVLSHEWEKDRIVITTNGIYPWSFVTQIPRNGKQSHGDDRKTFELMTLT